MSETRREVAAKLHQETDARHGGCSPCCFEEIGRLELALAAEYARGVEDAAREADGFSERSLASRPTTTRMIGVFVGAGAAGAEIARRIRALLAAKECWRCNLPLDEERICSGSGFSLMCAEAKKGESK